MTPEAIDKAIELATGGIRNGSSDLNAMHEVECWLVRSNTGLANPEDLIMRYAEEINKSSGGALGCFADICATSEQRAEAFLRTIGKWED